MATVAKITAKTSATKLSAPAISWSFNSSAKNVATEAATMPRGPRNEINHFSFVCSSEPKVERKTRTGRTINISTTTIKVPRQPSAPISPSSKPEGKQNKHGGNRNRSQIAFEIFDLFLVRNSSEPTVIPAIAAAVTPASCAKSSAIV